MFCCGVLVLLAVLIFVFAPYSTAKSVQIGDFEQVVLRTPGALYSGYVVDSLSTPTLALAAVFSAELGTTRLPVRNESQTVQIGSGLFQFFAYDLLPGSAVSVQFAFERTAAPVNFFVIVGGAQFKSWSEGGTVPIQFTVSRFEAAYTYAYTVKPSADVYFVFENPPTSRAASGVANFSIDAVVYDVASEKPLSTCTAFPCVVDPLPDDRILVVQGLPDGDRLNTERTMQYHVVGRVSLYFSIVGGTIGGVVFFVVVACLVKKLASRRSAYAALNESAEKVHVTPVFVSGPVVAPTPTPGATAFPPPVSPEFEDGPAPSAPAL